jgi:hypothetical protein
LNDPLFTADMLVYAAGVCYVLGFLIINQITLRLMLMLGTCFYILYYWFVAETPLWDAIYISAMIGCANLSGLLALEARKSRLAIPRAHRDIYDHFPSLPPGDFRTLMHHAKRYTIEKPTQLTIEGAPMTRLFYTLSGETTITKKHDLFKMPPGVFVGEVAFLTHQRASATTVMSAGSEVIEWSAADLRRASEKSSRFKMALEAALSLDMAQKVAYSVAPNEVTWRPDLAQTASESSSFSKP